MSDQLAAAEPPRLVVIGASAGGLDPLRAIARGLPADFPATVLVVVHVASTANSVLAEILSRVTNVGVASASDEFELRPGRLLVAPPDRHMVVAGGRARLVRGPRENGHRPAVDPLFRSAAEEYGAACCGVILSGSRDDGSAGLARVKAHGGIAIVQEPAEALHDGMPLNALAATDVDHVLPAEEIAPLLVRLARGEGGAPTTAAPPEAPAGAPELLSILCPECGGSLVEQDEGGVPSFRCHVGHRFTVRSLLAAHADAVERAMWTAARTLEDRAALMRRMADRLQRAGSETSGQRFAQQAVVADQQSEAIRVAIAALDDVAIELPRASGGAAA